MRSTRLAAVVALFACLLPARVPAEAQKPYAVQAGAPRFAVLPEATSAGVGRALDVKLELQDAQGRKTSAPAAVDIILTITTLPSLQRAREEAAKVRSSTPPAQPASLDSRAFQLNPGETVQRVPAVFPRGEGDVDFKVTSRSPGELRIFVEATGKGQVQPGSALIIVTEQLRRMRDEEAAEIQRVVWQPQAPARIKLKFQDSGQDVILEGKDFVRPFSVGIQDATGHWVLPPLDKPLRIQLSVTSRNANFDRPSLIIDPNDPISKEQTKLRSSVGGTVDMVAQSIDQSVADANEKFTYELGARATRLDVQPVSTSALANGLDAITVDVSALYDDGTQASRVLTAAQEGLAERRVLITFSGGSASQKSQELIIPKDATSQRIDVVSSSAARRLEVNAKSYNGFQQQISGKTTVEFSLPWAQLACAAVGGLLLPVIYFGTRRGNDPSAVLRMVLGGVGGALLYMVMFFGAVLTGEYGLGKVAVNLTKLPTENILAAFVLGVFGYLIVSPALSKALGQQTRVRKPA